MIQLLKNIWFLLMLRISIGAIFVYAGFVKFEDLGGFADSIYALNVLPIHAVNVFAFTLPALEIVFGVLLLGNYQTRAAALGVVMLLLLFGFVIGQALMRGIEVQCHCFGYEQSSSNSIIKLVARDIVLFLSSLWLYLNFKLENDRKIIQIKNYASR